MTIRKQILIYFPSTVILLTACALLFIYTLFAEYREERFQQRQKEKIRTTLQFLTEVKQLDGQILQALDNSTINDFYDEKLFIFNEKKKLVYKSVDNLSIDRLQAILTDLSEKHTWIETKEGVYDVIGMVIRREGTVYYGVSKAYDEYGYGKMEFLRYTLIGTFLVITVIVLILSMYLAKKISGPITHITDKINSYHFDLDDKPLPEDETQRETAVLARRFNELMQKIKDAFAFQKHAVHHISHELKTPIAVLVSNFERMEAEQDPVMLKQLIAEQKENTRQLGDIIRALLEIAKVESGDLAANDRLRVDELIFDIADELNRLYPAFDYVIEYGGITEDEAKLTVTANAGLLKSAFLNIMLNSIRYSSASEARIDIIPQADRLEIMFVNEGPVISTEEQQYLFRHFFRGANSKGKRGFGLGLVLVDKIVALHQGKVFYSSTSDHTNCITVWLPLS